MLQCPRWLKGCRCISEYQEIYIAIACVLYVALACYSIFLLFNIKQIKRTNLNKYMFSLKIIMINAACNILYWVGNLFVYQSSSRVSIGMNLVDMWGVLLMIIVQCDYAQLWVEPKNEMRTRHVYLPSFFSTYNHLLVGLIILLSFQQIFSTQGEVDSKYDMSKIILCFASLLQSLLFIGLVVYICMDSNRQYGFSDYYNIVFLMVSLFFIASSIMRFTSTVVGYVDGFEVLCRSAQTQDQRSPVIAILQGVFQYLVPDALPCLAIMILCTRELFKHLDESDNQKISTLERTESFVMNLELGFSAVKGYDAKKEKQRKAEEKKKRHEARKAEKQKLRRQQQLDGKSDSDSGEKPEQYTPNSKERKEGKRKHKHHKRTPLQIDPLEAEGQSLVQQQEQNSAGITPVAALTQKRPEFRFADFTMDTVGEEAKGGNVDDDFL